MRYKTFAVIVVMAAAVWAEDKFQPLNVKTGLWETTRSTTRSGEVPIPEEMLSRLTPEQRAKFEARMKANAAAKTTTHTDKSCVTKRTLEESPFTDQQGQCTKKILTSTSSKAEASFVCDIEGTTAKGSVKVEAVNSETVKGEQQITATVNGRTMNTSGTFTSKWLGSSCGNVE
jgi:hypothetical protein